MYGYRKPNIRRMVRSSHGGRFSCRPVVLEVRDARDWTKYFNDHNCISYGVDSHNKENIREDIPVNDVLRILFDTISSFDGNLDRERDMRNLIETQLIALHNALHVPLDFSNDASIKMNMMCKGVDHKIFVMANIYENEIREIRQIQLEPSKKDRKNITLWFASIQPSMDSDFPPLFQCPISMELMEDPVTIFTGVTYERKSIEKWLFTYNNKTCPATMQTLAAGDEDFVITPNLTLKRLILAWKITNSSAVSAPAIEEVRSLLATVESSPFKVSSLRKLRSMIGVGDEMKSEFVRLNGIGIVVNVVIQILIDCSDFSTFEACEEALGVLSEFSISDEDKLFDKMSNREELMKSITIVLQRGSAEGRFYSVKILRNFAENAEFNWGSVLEEQGIDFFKPLLELVSDEFSTKASSCALDVMMEILASSKRSRVKAIEAGAVCVLIELLPESGRSKCERMLQILQSLCECAEGRLALVEHGMGIAAVTKKILNVSNVATKMGVKILLWISSFHPKERVVEEMMACGAVKKLLMILHMDGGSVGGGGRSSTKEKVIKILKMNGSSWRRSPCFPNELKNYLKFVNDE